MKDLPLLCFQTTAAHKTKPEPLFSLTSAEWMNLCHCLNH